MTGIPCPKCGHTRHRVTSNKPRRRKIVRVRKCKKCGHEIRTAERIESNDARSGKGHM